MTDWEDHVRTLGFYFFAFILIPFLVIWGIVAIILICLGVL